MVATDGSAHIDGLVQEGHRLTPVRYQSNEELLLLGTDC